MITIHARSSLAALLLTFATGSWGTGAPPNSGFEAHYLASSQGVACGSGEQRLTRDHRGFLLYSRGSFCLFGEAENLSRLHWSGGVWHTHQFTAEVAGWFSSRYRGQPNENGTMQVWLDGAPVRYPREMAPAIQGAATMLQNLPLLANGTGGDVDTSYTWGEETRHYRFQRLGDATLTLMGREYTAIHLRQSHPHKSRVADFWFAPELNHQLVRLEVRRLGLLLLEVELDRFQPYPLP